MRSFRLFIVMPALAAGLAASHSIAGDFYKWVDEKGEVHYSDGGSGAPPKGANVQKKSFSDIDLNVVQQAEWPASIFSEDDRKSAKSSGQGQRSKPKDLPWFTKSSFDYDVLRSGSLTLVEFWAVWCGVCRKVDPVIHELAAEYGGKVKFGRVDIDEEKALSKEYGVRGVPDLLFFKDGKVVGKMVGGYARESYVRMIQKHL